MLLFKVSLTGQGHMPDIVLKLVNKINTESFGLGLSDFLHILVMARGQHQLIFKVRGQKLRLHARPCFFKNKIKTELLG